MLVFRQLRALAEFRRRHLPYLETAEDRDLTREIGHHQVLGAPLTLKQLLFAGAGSIATVQRRLRRLKRLGVVRQRRLESDRRVLELTLSPGALRAYGKYGMLLAKGQAAPTEVHGAPVHGRHHCALCDGATRSLVVAIRFLREGLRQKHKCVVVAADRLRVAISNELKRDGGKPPLAEQVAFYGGVKSPQSMITFLRETFQQARASGKTVHLLGEMSWTQQQGMGFGAAMDLEARLDPLARRFRAQVLCLYDVRRFSGPQLLRALKCHSGGNRHPPVLE